MYNHNPAAVMNLDGLGRGDLVDVESRESQRVRFPSRWPLFFSIFGLVCQSSVLAVSVLPVSSIPSAIKKVPLFSVK